jgi:2-oxoglutarate dehydrogenase E1 component
MDFTHGSFRPLIGEPADFDVSTVRRVVLCTGKIYYDLAEHRAKAGVTDTAIVRVERLYPVPAQELRAELSRYPGDVEVVWAQEEPENQGAWPRMALRLPNVIGRLPRLVALPASSAPAFGSAKVHAATHRELIETAIPQHG